MPVTPNSAITIQTPTLATVQFLQGSDPALTYKTLVTGTTNGTKVMGMYMTCNDTTAHVVTVQIKVGAVYYGGMSITTGTTTPGFATGVPPINMMSAANWPGLPVDWQGNPFLFLPLNNLISVTFATAFSGAGMLINLVAVTGEF
jgi:hypothetical protein